MIQVKSHQKVQLHLNDKEPTIYVIDPKIELAFLKTIYIFDTTAHTFLPFSKWQIEKLYQMLSEK